MKPLNRKCSSVLLSAVLAVLFSVNHSAFAATYYWDNNGTTAGFGTAGGTWAAPTASQWSTDGTGVAAPGASITSGTGDAINFGNGATGLAAGTVTVSGSVSSGNATFASGSGAIVLSGGTGIALAAPSVITINNAADTISTPIASGALTKAGTGALSLGGGGSISTLRVSNGTLAITGGTLGASSFSFVGDTASQSGVASVASGATLNFNNGNGGGLGYASAASGAIYNSGTFSATQLYMSDTANNGSYGYIQNAGTMTVNNSLNIARNNNANIVDVVAGGAATIGTSGGLYLATAANATAGLNITGGGTFTDNENGDQAVINSGSGAYTSINISGAGSKLIMVGGSGFNVNNNGGAVSTFTLANGGELDAAYTYTYNTGAAFNFNNGTLKATGANGLFEGGGPYAVYVYSGGAIINNNGFASTVQFPLLAPVADGTSTYGVTGITLGGTDTGYIGAPVVKITGGGGKGAAAIASFNPGTGTITGITVTAPGSGYTSTPTITLVGGNGGSTGSGAGTATATASIGAVSSGGVTFSGSGTTTLSGGASTYTGNTVISSGQLSLTGSASLASGNIIVSNNAMLDVSGISFTLGGSQNLKGNGTNNGSINTTSGSGIYADAGVAYGTNTFNNNLTLVSGATAYFNLGTVYNGSNDLINVTGSLVDNGSVQISAPSTSVNLDTNQDYVLITSTGFSGTLSPTPLWGVKPLNWRNFTVVQNGNNVQLHYTASTPPVATGSASPATVTRNQSTLVSVTVTPGSGTVDPNYGVSLNESSLGLSSVYLVLSGTPNVYTNTITIPATVAAGNYTLNALVTDSTPLTGAANISLAVVATNQIWNGAGANNFTKNNTNWISGFAPGYVGDAMTFAGNVNLSPDLDQNYTVTGVTFNANAGGFTISTAESTTLTLTNGTGVVNNSANVQTLNVPVVLGASQIINAASNNIVLSGAISGAAGLTKTGNGALTLSGNNTYSGVTTVSAGTAILSGNNTIGDVEATNGLLKITAGTSAVASTSGNTYVDRGGSLEVDAGATLNISGSTAWYPIGNTVGTTSTVTVAGGTINVANGYNTAVGRIGYGVLTINSGTFSSTDTHTIGLVIGDQGTAQGGTVNLNGGSLVANKLVSNNGTNYFYFNGGTLLPTSDTSSWWNYSSKMSAQVRNGGAIIDDTGVNVTIAQNLVHSTVVGDSAIDGGLIKTNTGTLTLAGTNTYTGNTVISAGTLALGTNGSIISTNINVTSGATFDVWALASYTLNSGQHLEGSGQVNAAQNGLVAAASGSAIYPGTDGTIGTLTINGGLTLNGGATVNFDLGTSNTADGGANDQITVSGALTLNGNAFHIKAPSSLVGLDTNSDYVLITAGSISGSFNSIPVWDVAPANSNNFSVVTSGGQVTLHYSTLTPPTGSGFATPSTAVHNQNVLISVTVTNGSGTVDPNTGVVLNASTIGGSSSVPLVLSARPMSIRTPSPSRRRPVMEATS
jgi:fibronectin-binding autotransporter adhesin